MCILDWASMDLRDLSKTQFYFSKDDLLLEKLKYKTFNTLYIYTLVLNFIFVTTSKLSTTVYIERKENFKASMLIYFISIT